MLQAVGGHLRALPGLGQDEGTLDHGLDVQRQAVGAPGCTGGVKPPRLGDVFRKHRAMHPKLRVAGLADGGVRVVDLLHQGAEQAGVVGQLALQDGDAKVDVAEQPVERVGMGLVRRGAEHPIGHTAEMPGGDERQFFLAAEVVEEAALGQRRGIADVFDARGRVTLAADDTQRSIEQADLGNVAGNSGAHWAGSLLWCLDEKHTDW